MKGAEFGSGKDAFRHTVSWEDSRNMDPRGMNVPVGHNCRADTGGCLCT